MRAAAQRLGSAGVDTPLREASFLLQYACGIHAIDRLRTPDLHLSAAQHAAFEAFVVQRAARKPLSRIIGQREFYGLTFAIDPHVLDPRSDTETLIDAFLQLYPDRSAPLHILDLCTGSGCIALTLLHLYPNARAVGSDIGHAALKIACHNARLLNLSDRFDALCADGVPAFAAQTTFDAVVSNPPYIAADEVDKLDPEVRWFDPHAALVGGIDGLRFYRDFAVKVSALCDFGAYFLLECGEGQSNAVIDLCMQNGFALPQVHRDLSSIDRCVSVQFRFQDL